MKFKLFTRSVFLIPLFWIMAGQSSYGAHLSGAWFNAVQTDTGKYIVYMKIIRDCNGIPMSPPQIKYTSGTTNFTHNLDTLDRLSIRDITGIDPTCGIATRCQGGSFQYGFEEHLYVDTVDLSTYSTCDWEISWEVSARYAGLTGTPVNFYNFMRINKCVYNSTPYFAQDVRNLLAHNRDAKIAYGVLDTMDQGDSFSYELVPALQAPNTSITYTGNFAYYRPLTCWGFPNHTLPLPYGFHINPVTGLIEFRPTQVNQFGFVVVEVKEWRKINGVMTVISQIRHDDMLVVIAMPNNNPPVYQSNQSTSQYQDYTLCTNDTFKLKLVFEDADGDSLRASMTGILPGATLEVQNDSGIKKTVIFKWKPDSTLVRAEPYSLTINTSDQVCPWGLYQSRTYRLFVQAYPGVVTFNVGNDLIDSAVMDSLFLNPTVSNPGNRLLQWHTSGDGQFVNQYDPYTTYVKGANDKLDCSFDLWLELVNKTYCGSTGSTIADSMHIFRVYPNLKIDTVMAPYYGDTVVLTIKSSILNGQSLQWSSSGDGLFIDSLSKAGKYVPGVQDWTNCGWWMYLDYDATGCKTNRDSVFISRTNGIVGYSAPDSVFRGDTLNLIAYTDSMHAVNVHWSSTGDGIFGDTSAAQTWYLPGTQDYQNCGSAIYLSEWPKAACGRVDSIWVAKKIPHFDAGISRSMVWIDTVSLFAGPQANANWNFGYWTTRGTGTFVDSNDARTGYIPSLDDLAQCLIYLYWNEYDQACGGRKDSILISRGLQSFSAGADQAAFYSNGMSFELEGTNDTSIGAYAVWHTQGDGTFSDTLDPHAFYYPGVQDLQNCSVTLDLTEYPDGIQCGIHASVDLTIKDSVVHIDGVWIDSATFDTIYIFHQGTTTRGTLNWSSTGTGTFVNLNPNVTIYLLSVADKNRTDIELTASYTAPCKSSTHSIHVDPSQVKTGWKELNEVGIRLFPNPTHDKIGIAGLPEARIEVYTMEGKKLQELQSKGNTEIDLGDYAPGSYLILVHTKENQHYRAIVKKH